MELCFEQFVHYLTLDDWIVMRTVCREWYESINNMTKLLCSVHCPRMAPHTSSFWDMVFWFKTMTSNTPLYRPYVFYYTPIIEEDDVRDLVVALEGCNTEEMDDAYKVLLSERTYGISTFVNCYVSCTSVEGAKWLIGKGVSPSVLVEQITGCLDAIKYLIDTFNVNKRNNWHIVAVNALNNLDYDGFIYTTRYYNIKNYCNSLNSPAAYRMLTRITGTYPQVSLLLEHLLEQEHLLGLEHNTTDYVITYLFGRYIPGQITWDDVREKVLQMKSASPKRLLHVISLDFKTNGDEGLRRWII